MSRYAEGTINVENGSSSVEGVGTDFVTWVEPGDVLNIDGYETVYHVAKVETATRLILSQPVVVTSEGGSTDLGYAIVRDFTAALNIPFPNRGEMDTAELLRRALHILDDAIDSGVSTQEPEPVTYVLVTGDGARIVAPSGQYVTLGDPRLHDPSAPSSE